TNSLPHIYHGSDLWPPYLSLAHAKRYVLCNPQVVAKQSKGGQSQSALCLLARQGSASLGRVGTLHWTRLHSWCHRTPDRGLSRQWYFSSNNNFCRRGAEEYKLESGSRTRSAVGSRHALDAKAGRPLDGLCLRLDADSRSPAPPVH